MADNPTLEMEQPAATKRKGVKRRAFLIGGVAIVGAGLFGISIMDSNAVKTAAKLTAGKGEHSFATWLKISEDNVVTIYSPHTDIGQGSNTGLAQMLAEELDANWDLVKLVSAPAESAFANVGLGRGFLGEMTGQPGIINGVPQSFLSFLARQMNLQITGGSTALRFTGQVTFQKVGAATRLALIETAAKRLGVPASELTTQDSHVIHAKSSRSLPYGKLAAEAATLSLNNEPTLKDPKNYRLMRQSVPRLDIPAKVDGTAQYGMDFSVPDMRVATIMAAPVRGGKLTSVDEAPVLAVKGVEKVIKLDDAVAVVGKGYWAAISGLRAMTPQFTDGGNGAISTASIFKAYDDLIAKGEPAGEAGEGDVKAAMGPKPIEAKYQVPFLHHAMMEPFALTAHYKDGKLDIWGGMQDPLASKMMAVDVSGLDGDKVTFHPMLIGGSFGRRLPMYMEIVSQVTKLAMQLPYPVKLIWSREEEIAQGAYRPQSAAILKANVTANKRIAAFSNDYAQTESAEAETTFIYNLPAVARRNYEHKSNQITGAWRSVNSTQQGFYNESFMDELAHAAGVDPVEFRRNHLKADSRHLRVLDECARLANWKAPLPEGVGRGVAIVESFKTIVAHVIEASVKEDGMPKVHKITTVVDAGSIVNPDAAKAQIEGGTLMGLSSAIGEAVTLEKGAVQQSNFSDYPLLKLADAPLVHDIHFINSGAYMGGIGEPGVPPAAPALANALFAATGKRVRNLPILKQAKA
ncbi:xanthine dehydrogenase family protein molybdopterin-binding subunit [Sphingorhabdus lacus]|uniref:Xanthine dehydrogenase family protein molybdopterin-binding subunit n=1 Tax=Sphingorhabdus lacus TaxID=392610 RepID=A0A6I6L4S1_9SPHN|nr:molybdopterin cofactor-binding domain-containing protein [Sphingorhabdus lacus]QGY79348.1 xanthine dehydrogenase family protein molybdopterin-binding subunit [Sphingorhabdus lacus]